MKDRITEINDEIGKIQSETLDKISKLEKERDEIIKSQNPPFLNPYLRFKDEDGNEFLYKINTTTFYSNGQINYYLGKIMTVKGDHYYCNDYVLTPERLGNKWKFISEVEFGELLIKGFDLIKKDII